MVYLSEKTFDFLSYALIIILAVLVFIAPCKEWNFIAEDYPIFYRVAKIETLSDFGKMFIQAEVEHLPTTYINPKIKTEMSSSFFDSFYRPGLLLVHFGEYHLFELNAYLYHLIIVLSIQNNTKLFIYGQKC